jgi:hypothetical protein
LRSLLMRGCSVAEPAASAKVPLCRGLTVVSAINRPEGDYESIKTIESVDAGGVRLKYSTERVARDLAGHPIQKLNVVRSIRTVDLQRANRYLQEFGPITPAEVPGTTTIGTPTAVLSALKSTGRTELAMFDLPTALWSEPPYSADPGKHPSAFDHEILFTIRRVEATPVTVALTVKARRPSSGRFTPRAAPNGARRASSSSWTTKTIRWRSSGGFARAP